jgi:hypothetical protein
VRRHPETQLAVTPSRAKTSARSHCPVGQPGLTAHLAPRGNDGGARSSRERSARSVLSPSSAEALSRGPAAADAFLCADRPDTDKRLTDHGAVAHGIVSTRPTEGARCARRLRKLICRTWLGLHFPADPRCSAGGPDPGPKQTFDLVSRTHYPTSRLPTTVAGMGRRYSCVLVTRRIPAH